MGHIERQITNGYSGWHTLTPAEAQRELTPVTMDRLMQGEVLECPYASYRYVEDLPSLAPLADAYDRARLNSGDAEREEEVEP